jgi:hypothetical protein
MEHYGTMGHADVIGNQKVVVSLMVSSGRLEKEAAVILEA